MPSSTPRVSVLIPTFNRAALLPDAIESVLRQSYSDYEILVVDDGSTDNTQAVLTRYEGRVRCIRCERGGPARARNVAFANAVGEYLCLLDSDDLYYEHKLALQVDYLDRYADSPMVYTEFSAFDDADGYCNEFHLREYHASAYRNPACAYERMFTERRSLEVNPVIRAIAPRLKKLDWLRRFEYRGEIFAAYLSDIVVFTNSMMIRRSAYDAAGPQNPYFGHFHDLEFALRVCKLGKVGFIDNPTYKLRLHPGQISAVTKANGRLNAIKLQRDLLRVARTHALGDFARHNPRRVRALMRRLCTAAAVPLLAYDGSDDRRRRAYPRKARKYLAYCSNLGYGLPMLHVVSFLPEIGRRAYFAVESRFLRIVRRLFVRTKRAAPR